MICLDDVLLNDGEGLLARNLRCLRLLNAFSQKLIAEILGIDAKTYRKYELDQCSIPISVLFKLAAFYETPVSWFFEAPVCNNCRRCGR